ncbi:uncharacterized protein LOC105686957 isoform X2 [Athalia rosae]|nr:uncharacterized protein LOC105686957 isoform X2 [Athalia rosae]XP_048504849.1 uncharacterized protein LOC105686957 isoform X2 [Athalia rosae]XP_048504850.1 uncharacterized protein LOC105686957 isoform X2 [Athalia rosae]
MVYHVLALDNRITDVVHRHARELTYPEDSEMGLFFALALPLEDPVSTKSISVAFFFEANYELPNNDTGVHPETGESRRKRSIDRRTIYEILQSKFESFGVNGRECLLRSICDTTRNPIHRNNGVLGDLMRIILTPSSSADEGLAVEYSMAETTGRGAGECGEAYPLCPFGIYDYITTAYE